MISVITVTFNNYDDLCLTLDSLKQVDGIEKIVINGGSCNKTKTLLKNFDGVSISEKDKGISDAFNKGVIASNGDNLMFLNSGDALISKNYLKEAEKIINYNPEISFVHSDLIYSDRISGDFRLTALQPFLFRTPPLGRGMPYHHQSMVVRKNVFDVTGLFNLNYKISMDFDWVCRLQNNGINGYYWNEEPVVRMDGGGISALKEHLVIWESIRALKNNKLLNTQNFYGITIRTLFFLARRFMETFGMTKILSKLKKEKHNLQWQRSRALAIKNNFSSINTKPEHIYPTVELAENPLSQKMIGLNGLLIHDFPTGLSRYSYELIRRILTKFKKSTVAYSTSQELNNEFPSSTTSSVPPFHYPANFRSNSVRLTWEQIGLRYACYRDKVDLLYSPVAEGILFPKLPQIITIHDLLPFHYPNLLPRWVPYYEHFLPSLIKGSSSVVCISEFTRKEVIERYPKIKEEKLTVIHCGVDLERFRPCSQKLINKHYDINEYILCVGEVRPYKNIGNVLRALKLWEGGPKLAISGKIFGEHKRKLIELAHSLNIENRVVWLGYVPDNLLPNLYSEAMAFIFPSLYEGFGLPIIESMACGCPTISSNFASLTEIGGGAASYFNPLDVENIAESIQKVCEDSDYQKKLSESGLKHAQNFNWDSSFNKHMDLFEKVLN